MSSVVRFCASLSFWYPESDGLRATSTHGNLHRLHGQPVRDLLGPELQPGPCVHGADVPRGWHRVHGVQQPGHLHERGRHTERHPLQRPVDDADRDAERGPPNVRGPGEDGQDSHGAFTLFGVHL